MLKKIHSRAKNLVRNLIQLWNWRKKDGIRYSVNLSENIESHVLINALPEKGASLSHIDFPGTRLSHRERKIRNKIFFKCILSQRDIESFTFTECHFIECVFNGATITNVEFHECIFENCFFYKTNFESTYIDPRSFIFSDHKWHWNLPNVNAGLFQSLYRNLKDMHQDELAMYADIRFQFYRRYQHLRGNKPKPSRFIISMLYQYLLGYGYGITNTLIATVSGILCFALLIKDHIKANGSFLEALYFSVVSFTTVGYGDLSPSHNFFPLTITIIFLLASVAWCAVVTAIIVKRIVK